jgi:ABC-type multidrug transport system fused ATPase/permease subunit
MGLNVLTDDHFDELGRPKKIKREMTDWQVLKRLFRFIGRNKDRVKVIILIIIGIISSLLNFINPIIIERIIDDGLGGGLSGATTNLDVIYENVGYLAILIFISIFFWFGQSYLIQTLANRTMYELRRTLFESLQRKSFDFYNAKNRSIGKIISYMTNDVETIQELISAGLLNLIAHLFSIVGGLIFMVVISWKLTLVSFLLIPFILLFAMAIFKNARRYFILMRRKVAAVTGHLNEAISGMRVIKAFAVEKTDYHKFDLLTDAELSVNIKAQRLFAGISPMVMAIIGASMGLIISVGSYLNINENLGTGEILAFVLYLMQFMGPLVGVLQFFSMVQNSMSAGERIISVIDIPPSIQNKIDAQKLPTVKGAIEFNQVNFGYEPTLPVLKEFTLKIAPKERIAIIGYTGAGKTTIVNLLCRFYDVTSGSIKIDGYDIRDVTLQSFRSQIGLVLQDNLLFSGSVKENIRYGNPDASDEAVILAAKKVGAHEFIMDLPQGYETAVREYGNLLSVGQKQLIAFARALLIDPPILILDEATSAVDPYSELIIQQALETLLKGRTSISIAHRLSTIVNADRIIVLDQGGMIESGNHKTLMENMNGMYRHLFLMQFKDAYKT